MKLIDQLRYLQEELVYSDIYTQAEDRVMYLLINPEDLKELTKQQSELFNVQNPFTVLGFKLPVNFIEEGRSFHSLTDPMFGTTYIIPSDRIEKGKLKVLKDNFISVQEGAEA